MEGAHLPSDEIKTWPTRLEKEAEFLLFLSKCNKEDYIASITSATEEQLKAILECLRNFENFRVHLKAQAVRQINKILQVSFESEGEAKKIFLIQKAFIQATLANIFLKIILTEFHFMFCQ